jgi:hypothetical protein
MRALIASLIFCSAACFAQPNFTTNGMNNGYLWEEGSSSEKKLYVTGIADGVFLQSVVVASKTGDTAPPALYPKGFPITDVVQGVDAFYQDRTNIKVPILFSYLYVMTKIKGAPQQELDAMAARLRQQANQ